MRTYEDILGVWRLVQNKNSDIENITVEFKKEGKLIYTVLNDKTEQKIIMTYEIIDNKLVTNQLSEPRVEETEFKILFNGELELIFDGVVSKYIKVIDIK